MGGVNEDDDDELDAMVDDFIAQNLDVEAFDEDEEEVKAPALKRRKTQDKLDGSSDVIMSQPTDNKNTDLLSGFVDKLEAEPEIQICIKFQSNAIKNPLALPNPTLNLNDNSNFNSKPSSAGSYNMNGFMAKKSPAASPHSNDLAFDLPPLDPAELGMNRANAAMYTALPTLVNQNGLNRQSPFK